jgi:predicted phage terminase large subunit-like protein
MSGQPRPGIDIFPQPGPQRRFLASPADVAVFGGAAGSGKSWSLMLEALRYPPTTAGFDAVFFRRTTVDLRRPGGLWSESMRLFPYAGGRPISHRLEWVWPGKGSIKLAHLEHEKEVLAWHGSQIPLILWDELTTFTEAQWWYLFSRNRSTTGIRARIRASCNADGGSWVAKLLSWYWDQTTGYPIPERSGVLRYFTRGPDDSILWFDTRQEAALATGQPAEEIRSFTFVAAKLADNQELMRKDPGYRANLMLLPVVERERLLNGNWLIKPSSGLYFQRNWVQVVDIAPVCVAVARGWDLASTPLTSSNDPDWTTSTKIGRTREGAYVVLDHTAMRGTPADVERNVRNITSQDGYAVMVGIAQDPGQAGKAQIDSYVRILAGYNIQSSPETGEKVTRFAPFSAQAEHGNVMVLRGPWNDRFFAELENFPEGGHDDDADSTSRAFGLVAASSLHFWASM